MILSWFPLTIVGDAGGVNATNNPFRILINRQTLDGSPWAAVLAQERYEWQWRFGLFLLGVLPVLLTRFGPLARHIEAMGHAIEIEVACRYFDRDRDVYTAREARALATYPMFDGSYTQALKALQSRRAEAARWVDKHKRYVQWAVHCGRNFV